MISTLIVGSAAVFFFLLALVLIPKKSQTTTTPVASFLGTQERRQSPLYDAIDEKTSIVQTALKKRFIEKLEKDVLEEAKTLMGPSTPTV